MQHYIGRFLIRVTCDRCGEKIENLDDNNDTLYTLTTGKHQGKAKMELREYDYCEKCFTLVTKTLRELNENRNRLGGY